MSYLIDNIQFALFFSNQNAQNTLDVWQRVTGGAQPNGFQTLANNSMLAHGPFAGGQLAIFSQNNRIDFILSALPNPAPPQQDENPPALGNAEGTAEQALDAMRGFKIDTLELQRVATVIQSHQIARNARSAAEEVAKSVPHLPLPEAVDDVNFQVAFSAQSKKFNNTLKIVCRWQSMQMQLLKIPVMGPQTSQNLVTKYAAHFYVDVASAPLGVSPPSGAMKGEDGYSALRETYEEAMKISKGGYDVINPWS